LRSGDLTAAPTADDDAGPLRILRASLDRWLVAGGARGSPLSSRNAWALIGLASGDQLFSERCLALLERPEELSRTRARLARGASLVDLAPHLRRRALLVVRQMPRGLRHVLEREPALVRTAASAAAAYGWDELADANLNWRLDTYMPLEAFSALQERLNQLDIDGPSDEPTATEPVLLRVVEEPWP